MTPVMITRPWYADLGLPATAANKRRTIREIVAENILRSRGVAVVYLPPAKPAPAPPVRVGDPISGGHRRDHRLMRMEWGWLKYSSYRNHNLTDNSRRHPSLRTHREVANA